MNNPFAQLKAAINRIYFKEAQLTEKDLFQSRKISIPEGCSARAILTICSGSFLAGLVKHLGATDQMNGIIGAIPTLAGIIMLFSPLVLEGLRRRKFLITFSVFFARLLFSFMFLIPLMLTNSALSLNILVGMFLAANLFVSFAAPAASYWIISITPEPIRGRYFGKRESIVLGFVAATSLALGRILDAFRAAETERTGFIFIFATAFVLTMANFIFSSLINEPDARLERERLSLRELFVLPLKSMVFRKIILIFVLWNTGYHFSAPFTAVYMVSGLKLGYTFITLCVLVASAASIIGARVLGKLADKRSWLFLMTVCVGFQIASQLIWFFVNGSTAKLFIPFSQILGGVAIGGVNIALSNIQYMHSPEERKTVYIGFSSAAGGLAGFISSLCGAAFIGLFSKLAFKPLGFDIGSMQLLFGISGLLLSCCIIFILTVGSNRSIFNRKQYSV